VKQILDAEELALYESTTKPSKLSGSMLSALTAAAGFNVDQEVYINNMLGGLGGGGGGGWGHGTGAGVQPLGPAGARPAPGCPQMRPPPCPAATAAAAAPAGMVAANCSTCARIKLQAMPSGGWLEGAWRFRGAAGPRGWRGRRPTPALNPLPCPCRARPTPRATTQRHVPVLHRLDVHLAAAAALRRLPRGLVVGAAARVHDGHHDDGPGGPGQPAGGPLPVLPVRWAPGGSGWWVGKTRGAGIASVGEGAGRVEWRVGCVLSPACVLVPPLPPPIPAEAMVATTAKDMPRTLREVRDCRAMIAAKYAPVLGDAAAAAALSPWPALKPRPQATQ
jgi:hypothetical protein